MDARLSAPIRAAGGLLWRSKSEGGEPTIEVSIIHRPQYDDWSLPKGKLQSGESNLDGAVREVMEETGFRVTVGRLLGETRYMKETNGTTRLKVVRWWAMEARSGTFTPNAEVDALRWVSLAEAAAQLTRESERELIAKFAHGPLPGTRVLVVRHASAGSRAQWSGDDRARPLDERGRGQASALAGSLAAYDVQRILSADVDRCTQTMEPLADQLGLSIEAEPLLSETGYPGRESEAVELLSDLGHGDGDIVVCSQGDVVPDLIDRLAQRDGVVSSRPLTVPKGGAWVLVFTDGALREMAALGPPLAA